jgi:cleavage and polyadenylation specificity factor subunit 4
MLDITYEFDFERDLRKLTQENKPAEIQMSTLQSSKAHTVVCRHWLMGLCQKLDKCEFLHRLDKSKMPICKHGSNCKIKNCHLKHETEEEKEECTFYRDGFCLHGPFCKFKHIKRGPDELPETVMFDQYGTLVNTAIQKKRKSTESNALYKITLCKHWLETSHCQYGEGCIYAHGEEDIRRGMGIEDPEEGNIYDPYRHKMDAPLELPFKKNINVSYFILQAPSLVSLARSKKRGVWAVGANTARDMNFAAKTCDAVLMFFVVRSLHGIYGAAVLQGNSVPLPFPGSILTPEFKISWLRTFRVPMKIAYHLRTVTGVHLGRTETDAKLDVPAG